MNKKAKSVYIVNWPQLDGVYNFTFKTNINGGTFSFEFKWLNDCWNGWCTLPTGEKRSLGVFPNTPNWTGSNDYGLIFGSELDTIGFNDLFKTSLAVLEWQ